MWWNFIGRCRRRDRRARSDWMSGSRFGTVESYDGAPLAAPELPPVHLKSRQRERIAYGGLSSDPKPLGSSTGMPRRRAHSCGRQGGRVNR